MLTVSLEEGSIASPGTGADVVALDDALKTLAAMDPRRSRVVELRFFGGLSAEETAEVLKVSARDRVARLEAGQGVASARVEHGYEPMKPELWEQIAQLHRAALEIETEARAAFLTKACAGDELLRREVESLLALEGNAENFMESSALGGGGRTIGQGATP